MKKLKNLILSLYHFSFSLSITCFLLLLHKYTIQHQPFQSHILFVFTNFNCLIICENACWQKDVRDFITHIQHIFNDFKSGQNGFFFLTLYFLKIITFNLEAVSKSCLLEMLSIYNLFWIWKKAEMPMLNT